MTLPNWISVGRILLIPVFMVALLGSIPGGDRIAVAVFAVAAATDSLDGYLARSRRSITTVGKFLDPLADKLLVSAALISLVELDRLAAWVAMVIIAREFAVTGLRLIAASQDVVIAASPWGKVKTFMQVAAIIALIVDTPPHTATTVLVALAVAATIWSGIEYFVGARDVLRAPA
ncbi:MAG: CDP-diacylglycerol--glycerol-3-phosphate 3-phosphatidyltransferase [Gaiellales bacterium]